MDVGVFSEAGEPLASGKGELVCLSAFPSSPTGFWNDSENKRFYEAYYSRFENVWAHGDYVERTANGGYIIHGRSDTVLNPGGVRIGTAEIYRQVDRLDQIVESVVVGQQWHDDVRVVLFVRLKAGEVLDKALEQLIRSTIRANATPRHVPAVIVAVDDIPRTRSGKISEIAVRKVIHGEKVANTESLANPEALECFRFVKDLDTQL